MCYSGGLELFSLDKKAGMHTHITHTTLTHTTHTIYTNTRHTYTTY